MKKTALLLVAAIALTVAALAGWRYLGGSGPEMTAATGPGVSAGAALVQVRVPELSPKARLGEAVYREKCASCHGVNAAGSDKGPPLVHRIYESGHHSDVAFVRAVKQGARAHHWPFGDMKPVEGVTDKQIEWIIRYIRELQAANGIS